MGTTSTPPTTTARAAGWVAALCWTAVLLDGFDLVVAGTVLPALSRPEEWGLSPSGATFVITIGLVGMTIGALTIGALTDIVGRRKALIGAVTSFSLFTLRCAVAPDAGVFGLLRFLAGVGLGGCLPTAIAMVNEFTRRKAGRATTTMMTGYHVGAVPTAALAIAVVEPIGWPDVRHRHHAGRGARAVDGAAAARVPGVPHRARPSRGGRGHRPRARPGAGGSSPARDRRGRHRPHLVHRGSAGHHRGAGRHLVHGAAAGPRPQQLAAHDHARGRLRPGRLARLPAGAQPRRHRRPAGRRHVRVGPRTAGIVRFAAGAVFRALLSAKLPIVGSYVMVFLTGCFVFSAQVLVYAFTSANHPPQVRATALGWAAGVGRVGAITGPVIGGALPIAGYAFPWGAYVFAVVGALGALALALTRVREDRPATI